MTSISKGASAARSSQATCPIIRGDFWDPSPDFTAQRNSLIEKVRASGMELPDGYLTVLRYKTRQSGASTGRKDWYYEGPHGKWDSVNKLIDSIKEHLGIAEPHPADSEPSESDESDQDMLVDTNDIATTLSRFQQEAALLGSWVDCSRLLAKCTDDWRQWGRVMLIMQELQCANDSMLKELLQLTSSISDSELPSALRSAQQGSKGSLVKSKVLLQRLLGMEVPEEKGKDQEADATSKEGSAPQEASSSKKGPEEAQQEQQAAVQEPGKQKPKQVRKSKLQDHGEQQPAPKRRRGSAARKDQEPQKEVGPASFEDQEQEDEQRDAQRDEQVHAGSIEPQPERQTDEQQAEQQGKQKQDEQQDEQQQQDGQQQQEWQQSSPAAFAIASATPSSSGAAETAGDAPVAAEDEDNESEEEQQSLQPATAQEASPGEDAVQPAAEQQEGFVRTEAELRQETASPAASKEHQDGQEGDALEMKE